MKLIGKRQLEDYRTSFGMPEWKAACLMDRSLSSTARRQVISLGGGGMICLMPGIAFATIRQVSGWRM